MTKAQEKARNLRYKRAALSGLNIYDIENELDNISAECDEVRYYIESGDTTLLNALIANESDEEEYEFRVMFSDLSAECEKLQEILFDNYTTEHFDDFFVGIMCGNRSPYELIGYDSFEEDYYRLCGYEREMAENESFKRLMRLAKADILKICGQCFGIVCSYFNIKDKYECLKAAFDILCDKNTSYLQIIKDIDDAYNKAEADDWDDFSGVVRHFESLVSALPDKTWIE